MSDHQVQRLTEMTEAELFDLLAAQVGSQIAPGEPEKRRRFGEIWFENRLNQLRSILCKDGRSRLAQADASGDSTALIGAIADLLAAHFSGPVVFTIAALTARMGLHRLCAGAK